MVVKTKVVKTKEVPAKEVQAKEVQPKVVHTKGRARTIAGRLDCAQTAIFNSLEEAEISMLLGECGYDRPIMEVGQGHCETTRDLQRLQEREHGQQRDASAAVKTTRQQAEATFKPILKLARVALKNEPGADEALALSNAREGKLVNWINQASRFYANALASPTVLAKLDRLHITQSRLEAGLEQINALDLARRTHERDRGQAQASTKARDAAMDKLDEWMIDFVKVARVALAGRPQLLEKLGIRTPS